MNHTGKAGKDTGKLGNNKPVSRSARAGLQFPVGRLHRHLKTRSSSHGRVGLGLYCLFTEYKVMYYGEGFTYKINLHSSRFEP